jgi:hypothetical protein
VDNGQNGQNRHGLINNLAETMNGTPNNMERMRKDLPLNTSIFFIYVQVLRATHYFKRLFITYPKKSAKNVYPVLSSDAYLNFCDTSISDQQEFDLFKKLISGADSFKTVNSIYLDGHWLGPFKELFETQKVVSPSTRKGILLVGGTDDTRLPQDFDWAKNFFLIVKVVNLKFESDFVKGLPLGIESTKYGSGGRFRYFMRKRKALNQNKLRPIKYLIAFNEATNTSARSCARIHFEKVKDASIIRNRIPVAALHYLMTKSEFVICPRGNGMDTHRIWESAYLGAVPVILANSAPGGSHAWPVLQVENWEDLIRMNCENSDIKRFFKDEQRTILNLERRIWSAFEHER